MINYVYEGDRLEEILILGHKNPDTDSVVSAYAYRRLKSQIDPQRIYRAGRCGNLNKQTRFIFERFQAPAPEFVKDVFAKVKDIMTPQPEALQAQSPLYRVFQNLEDRKLKSTPILNEQGELLGLIGMDELTHFYLTGSTAQMPEYRIRPENFTEVLDGYMLQQGPQNELTARVVVGAMSLERFQHNLEQQKAENLVLVVGHRENLIRHAMREGVPVILLTGVASGEEVDINFSDYPGWVFISSHDSAETMRRVLLSVPSHFVMDPAPPRLTPEQYVEEAKETLLNHSSRGLPVVTPEGKLTGFLSRSDLLKVQGQKLILMDHNEMVQAVDGAETAEIIEIIDHHRLGTLATKNPIRFYAKPVGATCTLVYQQYKIHGIEPEPLTANLLLSGILTDTVILKSPTTTKEDIEAVEELAALTGIDYQAWGIEIFSSTDSLKSRSAQDIIQTDFKAFSEKGFKFGIGQVEVVTLDELPDKEAEIYSELGRAQTEKGLDWTMLLVTDILKEDSLLLCTPFAAAEKALQYKAIGSQKFFLPKVLSRKKQLLPEISRVVEEIERPSAP